MTRWKVVYYNNGHTPGIVTEDETYQIALCNGGYDDAKHAAFIVQAVNAHERLIKSLRAFVLNFGNNDTGTPFIVEARALLAELEGWK